MEIVGNVIIYMGDSQQKCSVLRVISVVVNNPLSLNTNGYLEIFISLYDILVIWGSFLQKKLFFEKNFDFIL